MMVMVHENLVMLGFAVLQNAARLLLLRSQLVNELAGIRLLLFRIVHLGLGLVTI